MPRRFYEIDSMRIIGFLLVVDQHILGAYAQRPDAGFVESMVLNFLYLLGKPAVPMFVAITGFTLFYVNHDRLNVREFYRKRLAHIVMPYLFWSLASIVIFSKYHLLRELLLVLATGNASYHLWYMSMSIRIYLWFPLIRAVISRVIKKNHRTQIIAFIIFFIFYWVILKENGLITDRLAAILFGTSSLLEKRLISYSPIFWSLYFVCGVAVYLKYDSVKKLILKHSRIIIAAYFPLLCYMYYTQVCNKLPEQFPRISYEHLWYILYMLQTIVVVYIASVKISQSAEKYKVLITELSSLSFGAYLIHVIILQKIAPLLRRGILSESYMASGILIFITASALSFGLCYIIKFLPFSEYIIGVKTRPKKAAQARTYSV